MHYHKERNELTLKIVYMGPDGSGKTTNLKQLRQLAPADSRGRIEELVSETDDSIRIDRLTVRLGEVGGKQLTLQLWTAPGQPHARESRIPLLEEIDGIVFVADSQRARLRHNRELMTELRDIVINHYGRSPRSVPVVIQLNKRDGDDVLGIAEISRALDSQGATVIEAWAHEGRGVMTSLRTLTEQLVDKLRFMHLLADSDEGRENSGLSTLASRSPSERTRRHTSGSFAEDDERSRIGTTSGRMASLSGSRRPSTVIVKSSLVKTSIEPFGNSTPVAVATAETIHQDEVDAGCGTDFSAVPQKDELQIIKENGRRVLKRARDSEALEALVPKTNYECGSMGQEVRDLFHQMPRVVTIAGLVLLAVTSVLCITIWIS